jgi:large subunit ribosomal protein L2
MKSYKAITSSLRHKISIDYSGLSKVSGEKGLTKGRCETAGRNNEGRITSFHRGGGHKKSYRFVDFIRKVPGIFRVERIEYDPNRTAFIALVEAQNSSFLEELGFPRKYYILATSRMFVGQMIKNYPDLSETNWLTEGNCFKLSSIPEGSTVYNIELRCGQGSKLVRAAGASAEIVRKDKTADGYALIKLPSGQLMNISLRCRASLGSVGNDSNKLIKRGKAGASRWRGIKPTVRGVAMNPIDHPHGGGEGKTSGGRPSATPWGKPTKGYKTSRSKTVIRES